MSDIVVQLNDIKIFISDVFLVHFILTSLPSKYDLFKVFYNTHNKDWIVKELLTKFVQENRLSGEKIERMKHEFFFTSS